jgi:hypothetical protein
MAGGFEQSNVQSQEKPKRNYTLLILSIAILLVILIIIIFFSVKLSSNKEVSESQLIQGYSANIADGKKINFELANESHSIKINSVRDNSVEIIISSTPIIANLSIGEEKKFDINNDGNYELAVKLNNINSNKPNLTIRKISEPVPQTQNPSNNNPTDNQNNQQNIEGNQNNPADYPNNQNQNNQVACTENWVCSDWWNCYSGIQYRGCHDANNCTNYPFRVPKPVEERNCTTALDAPGICTPQYIFDDGFRCNGNTIEQKWQNANCSITWKESGNCSVNYKCKVTSTGTTCDLKTCSEQGGSVCTITQKCPHDNYTRASDVYYCCASSCQEKTCAERYGEICASDATCSSSTFVAADTSQCCSGECNYQCDINQLKSIAEADFATNSYWSRFTNITYKSYTYDTNYSIQWILNYCSIDKINNWAYTLMVDFSSRNCSQIAGHGYMTGSLAGC